MAKNITTETELTTDELPASQTRAATTRAPFGRAKTEKIMTAQDRKLRAQSIRYRNKLDIPEEIQQRFLEEGYALRWVRFTEGAGGKDDVSNVAARKRLGYVFVEPTEVPEFATGYQESNHNKFGDLIIEGDLALAKIELADKEAIIEAHEEYTRSVSKGIINEAKRQGVDTSGTKSYVTVGERNRQRLEE